MRRSLYCAALLITLAMLSPTFAQDKPTSKRKATTPVITVAVTSERVRFTALGEVDRLRLEVFNAAGDVVFDRGFQPGNVRDWALVDSQGQRLPDGTYTCVVTVRDLAGQLSFKQGKVLVQSAQAALALDGGGQSDALAPDATLAGSPTDEQSAMTAVMHTGTDGQVARTRGALTFRVGDFFSGQDHEQMRLTEEGNLGLGTKKPQAKLDVAGDIRSTGFLRATKGIEFEDGTVQTSGLSGRKDKAGNIIPAASGAGTQGRLAKWTDNSGTLGDSVALDTGTGLQLTALPSNAVDTNVLFTSGSDRTTGMIASATASFLANNGPYFALRGNTYSALAGQRGNFVISAGNVSSPGPLEGVVKFITGNDQVRMLITPTGNVGIGTTNPQSLLDVAGIINTATQFNIGGNRVLSVSGNNSSNTFAGVGAGSATIPDDNSFTGINNSFFGNNAGASNTTGHSNSFFGISAGQSNATASGNAFFGFNAGAEHTSGTFNAFFGADAGQSNQTGGDNTAIGGFTDVGINLNNATAIGASAQVTQSNSLVLGSISGVNQATADTNVGIGTTAPQSKLHVVGNTSLMGNVGISTTIPHGGLEVVRNWDGQFGALTLTADRPTIRFSSNNSVSANQQWILHLGSTAGTAPAGSLSFFNGGTAGTSYGAPVLSVTPNNTVMITTLGGAGGTSLCRNSSNEIANCSSSLRYKTNVTPFVAGLALIKRLRPIEFTWKQDGQRDLGLGAEEVASVAPLLTFRNQQGEIEGVKYNQLSAVLINAIKEQQQEIEQLRATVRQLQAGSRRHRFSGRR